MKIKKTTQPVKISISTLIRLKTEVAEDGQTIVHCRYTSKHKYINGGWVNIYPTTYLKNRETGVCLELQHAENIPLAPGKHYFKEAGQIKKFTLIFPKLPKDWSEFDFIENCNDHPGFTKKNIQKNDSGVYEITLD